MNIAMTKLGMTIAIFILAALVFLMGALYIPAKAKLAQYLLEQAWDKSRETQTPVPPWPWADTFPVAKMRIPSIQLEVIILSGSSGRSLAFAPGHISASVNPGDLGNSLISAHRDTHFQNLDRLKSEDLIYIERADGQNFVFKVADKKVIDTSQQAIALNSSSSQLGLMTCYPLRSVQADPNKRLMVFADIFHSINK